MYRDNSLIPLEAMRIAALGALAEQPMRYAEIAADVRRFASRIVGPSLDLMGTSIEVLRAEGLIESSEAVDDPLLTLTPSGREDLITLLKAGIRATNTELNRLVVALKMRFLHLLSPHDRQDQIQLLQSLLTGERERYNDLQAGGGGHALFNDWLHFELEVLDARLAWLERFSERCDHSPP
jgi:DNA-binding PadR family transcriptional regulator